jgi:mRNA interferase RelE/StbE
MRLIFSDPAWRQLSRLSKPVQKRVLKKIDFWLSQEKPLRFAEPLVDPQFGQWRFRVGDYRLVFDVERDTIVVLAVGHRKDIYR